MRVFWRLLLLIPITIGSLSAAFAAQPEPPSCLSNGLPTTTELAGIPLHLEPTSYYSSGPDTPVFSSLKVTDVSSSVIKQFVFILEFLDEEGKTLGQVLYAGGTEHEKPYPLPIYQEDDLSGGLTPGSEIAIGGASLTLWAGCPARAHMTYLYAAFSDSSTRVWSSPGWSMMPVLNYFPEKLSFSSRTAFPPSFLKVRARIDDGGKITNIAPEHGTELSDVQGLTNQIAGWTFIPAFKDGSAVASEVTIVIQFLPTDGANVPFKGEIEHSPYIVVKATPEERETGNWRLFCELRYGGSSMWPGGLSRVFHRSDASH